MAWGNGIWEGGNYIGNGRLRMERTQPIWSETLVRFPTDLLDWRQMSARTAEPMTAWRDFLFNLIKGIFTYQYDFFTYECPHDLDIFIFDSTARKGKLNERDSTIARTSIDIEWKKKWMNSRTDMYWFPPPLCAWHSWHLPPYYS